MNAGTGKRARTALACLVLLGTPAAQAQAPSFDTVRDSWRSSEARLLDRYGQPLAEVRVDFDERRLDWVGARTLSPPLVRALLVAEDKRFLEHSGVDWTALAGATWDNLWRTLEGRRPRGASTLTMQLAGLIDPALRLQGTRRSVGQKWDQAAAAREIERRWNKAQILEAYFNLAPFRGELRGISAATRGLFGKDPDAVDAREALLLAALLRGPNAPAERVAQRACAVALKLKPAPACAELRTLANQVLTQRYRLEPRWTEAQPLARRLLREPGEQRATTLDARLQRRTLDALGRERADVAVVVLDNASGEALVWAGGPDDTDAAVRRLPAGSTLHAFAYGLALEQRWISAASVFDDSPNFVTRALPPGLQGSGQPLSTRAALTQAAEIPALRVRALIGDDALTATLRAHGIDASATNGSRASLPEMANAFRTLANDGIWTPWALEAAQWRGVDRSGKRLWASPVAWLVGDLLSTRTTPDAHDWHAVMHGRSSDRATHWSVGWTRRYTIALRAARPVAATWLSVAAAIDPIPAEAAPPPPGLEGVRLRFEPEIEAEREEYFLPGTQQAFADAIVRDLFGRPRIVQPSTGVKLVSAGLPAGRQAMLLEARPGWPGLQWVINDERLPAIEGRALWSPRPGRHRLALEDAHGLQLQSIEFEVRLDAAPEALNGGPALRTPPGPTPASR
ncbi:MAG: transglycosylase domain-containing protein [Methyloversatilis sp.]|uniref:transglycosylase domain-containing protein n=1 Tax=Methyloversatilis sp. TaxID=2569862 RepID=UPI0025F2E597|nr:transglycosylase domain-containing protein [Methyloversatilis sp.]MCR6664633.1 transglycosylase domain-containing protein [Methyloversatilis sp.]